MKELSAHLRSHLFLSHTPRPDAIINSPPKTYLIAFCFIFDPWCFHVKPCICFVDVMTIASTILMMCWDWPNARQRSGTDEKTWLSDFLFSRSSMSACVPSCRVLYHYWQSWNIQQQVFISRFIFRNLFISTVVPFIKKKTSKTGSLHRRWIFNWTHALSFLTSCDQAEPLYVFLLDHMFESCFVSICVWLLLYLEQ